MNLGAIEEFDRVRERLTFLTAQRRRSGRGARSLTQVIGEIDITCKEKFLRRLHRRSRASSRISSCASSAAARRNCRSTDPENVLESGIEINVLIPGKRNQNLVQLSGGERALTALALLFAMLRVKPSPFVVLDEIDAPLDEANVGRYCDVLRDFCRDTQFLTVTHNKGDHGSRRCALRRDHGKSRRLQNRQRPPLRRPPCKRSPPSLSRTDRITAKNGNNGEVFPITHATATSA